MEILVSPTMAGVRSCDEGGGCGMDSCSQYIYCGIETCGAQCTGFDCEFVCHQNS